MSAGFAGSHNPPRKGSMMISRDDGKLWGLFAILAVLCLLGSFRLEWFLGYSPTIKLSDVLLLLAGVFFGLMIRDMRE